MYLVTMIESKSEKTTYKTFNEEDFALDLFYDTIRETIKEKTELKYSNIYLSIIEGRDGEYNTVNILRKWTRANYEEFKKIRLLMKAEQ